MGSPVHRRDSFAGVSKTHHRSTGIRESAMRESAGRRLVVAMLFAFAAGALVHFYNPMDHFRADLRADTGGVRFTLEFAAHAVEKVCERI